MDLETFEWLLTDDGTRAMEAATLARNTTDADPVRSAEALRRSLPTTAPEHRAAALTQVHLRNKAEEKFGTDAQRMWFTPDGLEQATRHRVAAHRAARVAAVRPHGAVVDLGCGVGGDLIALARAGLVAAGVDLDPLRVAIARANLDALDLPGAVAHADATTIKTAAFDVAFADPARRSGRGRTFNVEDWMPPWSWVMDLLQRSAVVKVAPGIPHDLLPVGVEGEWVSDHGDLKEASLWSPMLATVDRRATVIGDGGLATLTDEDDPYVGRDRPVRDLGAYLYEPDDAVIRAGLVTAVAAGVGGGLLDSQIAYVTGDEPLHTPYARAYRVVEQLPYREKQLKAALRERGIGRLTIKKRGVDVVPEQLRKRLQLVGDDEATLVLTRARGEGLALLVRPI